jgi:hypothetical protein
MPGAGGVVGSSAGGAGLLLGQATSSGGGGSIVVVEAVGVDAGSPDGGSLVGSSVPDYVWNSDPSKFLLIFFPLILVHSVKSFKHENPNFQS